MGDLNICCVLPLPLHTDKHIRIPYTNPTIPQTRPCQRTAPPLASSRLPTSPCSTWAWNTSAPTTSPSPRISSRWVGGVGGWRLPTFVVYTSQARTHQYSQTHLSIHIHRDLSLQAAKDLNAADPLVHNELGAVLFLQV